MVLQSSFKIKGFVKCVIFYDHAEPSDLIEGRNKSLLF